MGIIRNILAARKMIKEAEAEAKKYKEMTEEEFYALDDDEFYEGVQAIIAAETIYLEPEDCLKSIGGALRTFYILDYFDMEMQNGGLCQFFVNSSRAVAPYVGEALKEIGADEYYNLYHSFCEENQIDLTELDSYSIERLEDYAEQLQRQPFDEFDDAYYALYEKEPLCNKMAEYMKKQEIGREI
ncbi:DUF4375 domain-containing protein [Anaerotruncus sp. 80]|uniref:DUF4375 domain-containing protein n=1 Tax=Anaerotruncus colihominis TaxID=169435 RepID=A0A845QJY2_9FIRM|nr:MULTISPECIES: DUF4375 domain-containing protein [Anaerotruncus]NBH61063.1 DUF4375 domain-containing protein [Anaerotruncus colihominis]NCF01718.1 DUF4375 domain-containing protein [Anaerotruncus sp. 80]